MSKRIKDTVFWAGVLVIVFGFCYHKSFLATLPWILGWGGLLGIINWLFEARKQKAADRKTRAKPLDPRMNTPRKAIALLFRFQVSSLLVYLNPLLVAQVGLQLAGLLWEKTLGRPVLEASKFQQTIAYRLPVAGEWQVFNGGITRETSHSWGIPSQRFAYDLVKLGINGLSFAGDGLRLTDYFCFDTILHSI